MSHWNSQTQSWEEDAIVAPATTAQSQPVGQVVDPPGEQEVKHSESPWPFEQVPVPVANPAPSGTTDEPKPQEPTIEENANMISELFAKIVNKAVNATELAKRVVELERMCNHLEVQLQGYASELALEKAAHEGTSRELQNVQATLAQRESAIHDLVMERDIVVGERNQAQNERDGARHGEAYLETQLSEAHRELEQERHRNHVLEERTNTMTHRVNALKEAFGALHSL